MSYRALRKVNVEPGGGNPSPYTLRNSITGRKALLTALLVNRTQGPRTYKTGRRYSHCGGGD